MKHYVLSGALAAGLGLGGAAPATDTLPAVHAFPTTLIYTQSFL
ncbi:C4-dicarboxylate ABC transporter substrate-binding protein, partial [Halomonas marinisediminis]